MSQNREPRAASERPAPAAFDATPWRYRWNVFSSEMRLRALEWGTFGMAAGGLGGFWGAMVFPPHLVGEGIDRGVMMLAGGVAATLLGEGASYLAGAPRALALLRERFGQDATFPRGLR